MPTMLILRGIAGHFAGRDWPRGALDEPSALAYAKARGYDGRILDVAGATGSGSLQVAMALTALRADASVTALYGFSGGGYNVLHILDDLSRDERARIKLVVVLGAPSNPPALYRGPWELVYRTDPPSGHMDGPRALLASLPKPQPQETAVAASDFDESLKRVLEHEGGYSNDLDDPGGPTNFGITIGDYREYVNRSATAADVRSMPLAVAERIYRDKYWNALRCDELPAGIDYCVFDYGVNSGIGRAGKVLAVELHLQSPTSKVTDAMVAAAKAATAAKLINDICDERINFLRSLSTWDRFGRGWSRRVAEVRTAALAMAAAPHAAPSPAIANAPAPGKAPPPPPPTLSARQATGLAAGAGSLALLAHFAGAHPLAIAGVFILAVLAIAAIMFEKGAKA
jgi:lysozyme family protein